MSIPRAAVAASLLLAVLPLKAAAGDVFIYSYDPISPSARTLTTTGLSFEFQRGVLGGVRVHKVIQTGDRGEADLKLASEAELGAGGVRAALGQERPAGPLYEILPAGDGKSFVHAVCPGADRAWLLIGKLDRFKDLELQAVGRRAGEAKAHACSNMAFGFKSDWRLPDQEPGEAHIAARQGPS